MVSDEKDKLESKSETSQQIFKDVTYYIVGDVSQEVIKLLDCNGAKRDSYLSDIVSHVIADSTQPEEYSEAKELFERPVVSSQWVILSVKCGKQLPKEIFALEGRLFSGLRVCPHQLDAEDARALWGMVTFHGGRCLMTLNHTVTHLVTAVTSGEKYEAAMRNSEQVTIVTPDWFTDSIQNKQLMDPAVYHPKLIVHPKPPSPPRVDLPSFAHIASTSSESRQREVEPMDISPTAGSLPFPPRHGSPGAAHRKMSAAEDMYRTNDGRPDNAREMLARVISNRIQGSGAGARPDIPLPHPFPQEGPQASPHIPQAPHPGAIHAPGNHSHLPQRGMGPAGMFPRPGVPGHEGGVPSSGGLPNPAMASPAVGAPSVPTSMHMCGTGLGQRPGLPSPQHQHAAQFPAGYPQTPPHQHPHQLQRQRQHEIQQMQQQMHQQQQQQQQQHLQQQQQMQLQQLQQQHQHQQQIQHQQQMQQHLQQQQQQMQQQQQQQMQQQQQQQIQQQQQQMQQHQQIQQQQQLQQQQQQIQHQQGTPLPPPPMQPSPTLPPPVTQVAPKAKAKKRQKQSQQHGQAMAAQQGPSRAPGPDGGLLEEKGANRTLRNITNSGSNSPGIRPAVPMKQINQIFGLGGPCRPPPPAYPYPPQSPGSQPVSAPPPPPPQFDYFGYEFPENIPPELCLLGCVFYFCDYQAMVGTEETSTWSQIIEQYGGRVSSMYCEAVTHVLCCDQKLDSLKLKALEDEKRMVTAFWLNDCLLQKKMTPPWQALHIPLMFTSQKPCKNQIISITNFNGEERKRVKQMISAIGAKYTGYMTRANSVLICKRPGGMKFEKAKEWRVPVVNVQWLSDLVLGQMDALRLPVQMRYLQVGHARDFNADLARVWHWMRGWRRPLRVLKEVVQKAVAQLPKKPLKTEVADAASSTEPPAKKPSLEEESPLPEDDSIPRILFTGYPVSVVKRLTAIAEKLGGRVTDNPQHCTHLVSQKLTRTIKFFHAINVCRHIITKEWLEESSLQGRFLEEEKYHLKDDLGEREVGCNLQESLRRAKTSPIFQGLVFYITPGVTPPVEELKKVIESAGGAVLKRRPSAKTTCKMRDDKGRSTFTVISCPNDLHLCRDLMAQKIDVYSAEMALTGVLRQELDWNMYRIDYQLMAV